MGISYGFGKFLISVTMNITNYVWYQKNFENIGEQVPFNIEVGGGGGISFRNLAEFLLVLPFHSFFFTF